jgi:hypothetical protein
VNAVVKPSRSIDQIESEMLKCAQVACDVTHSFAPGLYVRQVTVPADTLALGHYQKSAHLNVMISGRVTMIEPDGSRVERCAPLVFVGQPGRKVGYIHETMVWLNIYATDETDVEKIEAKFLDKSEHFSEAQKRIGFDRHEDIEDFQAALEQFGITAQVALAQSENLADQMPFPVGSYKVKVGASHIEGKGLIATNAIERNEHIAPARIKGCRTPAGRYTNHAKHPNAKMVCLDNGDIALIALRDIAGCHGGMDGEEVTVDYRQAVEANLLSTNYLQWRTA